MPSNDDVRENYAVGANELDGTPLNEGRSEFDHWLLARDAEVQQLREERDRYAAVIEKALALMDYAFYSSQALRVHLASVDSGAALAGVKAQALEDARVIRDEMERDEIAMHMLSRKSLLPQLSRVMLNGATRFAERLTVRAEQIRKEGKSNG